MTPLPAEDIVPSSEFDTDLSEIVGVVRQRGRPLVITENGKPAVVVLAPDDFDALTYHSRVVAAVQRGLADVEAGRVFSDEEVGRELERQFGPLDE